MSAATEGGIVHRVPLSVHRAERAWAPFALLLLAAAVIEGVLLWLTSLMSLREFFPGKAGISLDFVKMLGPDWQHNTLLQFEAFVLLFAAFFLALWVVRRLLPSRATLAAIFLPPIAWAVTAAFMYPPYAVDLFHDFADSRLLWIYHLNPMVVAPIVRPFAIGTSYGDQPSAYGPFWYLLSFPAAVLAPHSYMAGIIVLKLWIAAFYLGSGVLIYLILREYRADLALLGTAVYLWNPFVIVRSLGDAHNDVLMFFFVLLTFYVIAKKEWPAVFPALMLSVLVKYVSLILGPPILVYVLFLPRPERNRALIQLVAGGFIALVLGVLIFIPFWTGPHLFDSLRAEGNKSITSLPLLLQVYVTDHLYGANGGAVARLWMRLLFLIPYAWVVLRVRPPERRLHAAVYQVIWLYILIAVAWFRPWYLLWVVTIGALLPSGWFLALTLTISWFGMFPDIVEQYRNFVPWLTVDISRLYLAPVVVAYAVPAIVWLAGLLHYHSWYFPAASAPLAPETLPAPTAGGD